MDKQDELSRDRQLRRAFPQLWQWYDAHGYPDPRRPVRSGLVLAVIRRVSYLVKLSAKVWLGRPPNPEDPSDDIYLRVGLTFRALDSLGLKEVGGRLWKESEELLRWLLPIADAGRTQQILATAAAAGGPDCSLAIVTSFSRLIKSPRGRRPTAKRLLWVRAYEEKLRAGQKLSWMQIAIKYCETSHPGNHHTQKCKNRLRQGARKLERVIRKYGIEIPPAGPPG